MKCSCLNYCEKISVFRRTNECVHTGYSHCFFSQANKEAVKSKTQIFHLTVPKRKCFFFFMSCNFFSSHISSLTFSAYTDLICPFCHSPHPPSFPPSSCCPSLIHSLKVTSGYLECHIAQVCPLGQLLLF